MHWMCWVCCLLPTEHSINVRHCCWQWSLTLLSSVAVEYLEDIIVMCSMKLFFIASFEESVLYFSKLNWATHGSCTWIYYHFSIYIITKSMNSPNRSYEILRCFYLFLSFNQFSSEGNAAFDEKVMGVGRKIFKWWLWFL